MLQTLLALVIGSVLTAGALALGFALGFKAGMERVNPLYPASWKQDSQSESRVSALSDAEQYQAAVDAGLITPTAKYPEY